MRRFFQLSALCLAAGSLSSCKTDIVVATENIPTAGVRFINAVPDSSGSFGMDLRFIDLPESNAHYRIVFRNGPSATSPFVSTLTQYKGARAGTRKYKIFLDDTLQSIASTIVREATPTLLVDHNYTVILWGKGRTTVADSAMRLDFIDETERLTVDPGAQVALRVFNATANAIDVRQSTGTATVAGTPPATPTWASVLPYTASTYVMVNPGEIWYNVRPAGGAVGTNLFADARALPGLPATCSQVACTATVAWVATTAYAVGALVLQGGLSYKAAAASTGVTPGTDATKWEKMPKPDIEANPGVTIAGSAVSAVVFPRSTAAEVAPGAPTVALAAAAGNVDNGLHRYRVTLVTALPGETQGGTISGPVTVVNKAASGQVTLTGIAVGGVDVRARKIYRTPAATCTPTPPATTCTPVAGSAYFLVATISDNTTTTFTDNVADASLGASIPTSNSTARTPQTAAFAVPAITFMWDRRPPRTICTPLC